MFFRINIMIMIENGGFPYKNVSYKKQIIVVSLLFKNIIQI